MRSRIFVGEDQAPRMKPESAKLEKLNADVVAQIGAIIRAILKSCGGVFRGRTTMFFGTWERAAIIFVV